MLQLRSLVLVVVMLASAGVAADSGSEIPVVRMDGVAAYVNGKPITISDVIRTSRGLQEMLAKPGAAPEALNAAYAETLEGLIAAKLVVSAYDAQKQLTIPDTAIDERLDGIIDQQFNGDRIALAEALTREGLSLESWREQVREGIVMQAMRSQNVERHVRVSPAEVKAAFAARRAALARPGRVKLRMIVGSGDEGKARVARAKERLAAGEPFAELAKELSTGAYASKGGDRGWMALPDLRAELRKAVEGVESGHVSNVVKAGDKYYLLQVEEVMPAESVEFEEVAALLERELRAKASQVLFREWVASLRQDAYVRIVEEAPF